MIFFLEKIFHGCIRVFFFFFFLHLYVCLVLKCSFSCMPILLSLWFFFLNNLEFLVLFYFFFLSALFHEEPDSLNTRSELLSPLFIFSQPLFVCFLSLLSLSNFSLLARTTQNSHTKRRKRRDIWQLY